jgi:hypothetical protein
VEGQAGRKLGVVASSADGPYGLEVDPQRPWIAYDLFINSVYGTVTGEQQWQAAWTPLAGLENLPVLSVAIDPFNPARIYAGTAAGGGLFVYHRPRRPGRPPATRRRRARHP